MRTGIRDTTITLLILALCGACAAAPVTRLPLAPAAASAPPAAGAGKVTDLTPDQAWRLLQQDPRAVILDVRTQAEYVFVGHPAGAVNLPLEFWDAAGNRWSDNADFDAQVQARLDKDRAVILMCRSGNRSRKAAERMVRLGFIRVYNMVESFEGDADRATGLRTVNGWKVRGLPVTFDVDPKLYYKP
jgi:rhodanese-related sulfurtransferase